MSTDERIDKLAAQLEQTERIMRQGFATLTDLHVETQHSIQRMDNALQHLLEIVGGHELRIRKLERP